ncbi:hypothetical protein CONPUDRAFT_86030 [Coniophora puteana RWD-64-598 SS2]|uniref:Uncharacterized protein n=1 Tax=Coniophora puteana (strain RWD-64-598) TaxID=741705 RepID=R7SE66_CONPW|nr:uncharacterized protein CONPUDRAFT_86030 [Coniophora puteana RWD-64-598 SS2]EIW74042.1 hypothetical protein CONPUDRAFT_86030 [Coniophora puteana RWD-64-598 SS2]
MKLTQSFGALLFAAAALAQNVIITLPTEGQSVTAGSNITVDVERPEQLTGFDQVALIISMTSCASGACLPMAEGLDIILYNGAFNPVEPNPNPAHQQPNQNFTVAIPAALQKGEALIGVTQIALVSASLALWVEYQNVTVNVV